MNHLKMLALELKAYGDNDDDYTTDQHDQSNSDNALAMDIPVDITIVVMNDEAGLKWWTEPLAKLRPIQAENAQAIKATKRKVKLYS